MERIPYFQILSERIYGLRGLITGVVLFFNILPFITHADDYPWKVDRTVYFPHEQYSTIDGFNILYECLISTYSGEHGAKLLKNRNYHNLLFEIVMETKGHPGGEPYCKNGETVLVYRSFWVGDEGDVICHISLYMDMACEEYKKDEEAFYAYFGLDPSDS